ncbi:MAG TPA: FG-GAP-like repeat-containing protein [Patescibacteria group bacterium]|nr:FG-GAP-like repeat-containing protein [Patescibacteria group bacterium]
MPHDSKTPAAPSGAQASPTLSPRRRRLRWTGRSLAAVTILGIGFGFLLQWKSQPKRYRPDEREPEITSKLSRSLPNGAPMPRFRDVTSEAGLAGFRTFIGNRTSQLPEDMGAGVAWGDFNNDGYDDVFLVSVGGPLNAPEDKLAPCELYENLGDGTFRKVVEFPELRIHGMSAAWADYDGDGYLDLVVTGYNTLLLFHNEGGTGKFVRDSKFPNLPGFWSSATWGDYDNDRRPDLYVCGYVQYTSTEAERTRMSAQIGTAVPYTLNPSSYAPALNRMFHNNGDGTFTDVSEQLHVTDPNGRSLGALWHDFDDDGWLDLYVANDVSDNVLYHNLGGSFEDISDQACVKDYRSAMGLAAGDYDRDGDDDLFIGHWVGQENALFDNLWADGHRYRPQPGAGGASVKTGRLMFTDVADMVGVGQIALQYVSWGTEFVDLDGDGWLDLVVVNGSTLEQEGPFPRKLKPEEAFVFWNDHRRFFHNLAPLNNSLKQPHVSRGMGIADFNNDGAMDILISFLGEGVQLLRNDMQTGHWLKARLHSRLNNGAPLGFGDGAKVIAHIGDVGLRRTVSSASYLSQSSREVHFGLGEAQRVNSLEVRWLGGQTNFYDNLQANTTWELTEGDPAPKRFTAHPQHCSTWSNQVAANNLEPTRSGVAQDSASQKERVLEFWRTLRAAMNAMKIEKDNAKAISLFRAALVLDPEHEDARYYLGQCLAAEGDAEGALTQFEELTRINPHSHRGFQQWGVVRACNSRSDGDLAAAEKSLERAHSLNPEETGALLVLGEVSLMRGDLSKAEERLRAVCQTNAKGVGAFFLRGYVAWQSGEKSQAQTLLENARAALGKDWQPKGTTAEGDVKRKQHVEASPLISYWEHWDGTTEPDNVFGELAAFLKSKKDQQVR